MPTLPDRVDAGDLITADDLNDLISSLEDLQKRVADLENQQGGVVINGFNPPNEVEVGQPLTIVGTNFEFPPDQNTLELNGREITDFLRGSTNTQLRISVPEDIQVPQGGRNVTVRVENDAGSAQRVYRLLPASTDQPTITSVTSPDTSAENKLIIGTTAVVEGENFGSTAADNVIEFIITQPDGSQVTYPDDQSNLTMTSVSSTRLEFIVPDMQEVSSPGGRDALLRVTVDGLSAEQNVTVLPPL
ncbi:MAG: IPT/TIG domain-containing protein [Salinivenus sp.]|uniref:IPT/TIG domain-containing protein n=1 Tax=Salinibacter sp. TaxID=2065818 RepID=UPI002FC31300